jgi:exoribonuclease II
MDRMSRPDEQVRMRLNASRIAPTLSDRGITDWLTASISSGAPVDQRFDDLFAGYES